MSAPHDGFEARLASLEREVAQLREQVALSSADAAAARVLAAGADHDVAEVRAELRAHTQVLNALRETQLEQGREMREGFAEHDRKITAQGREMREGFATLATGMAQITALLTQPGDTEGPS
jgi:chromosome segregation ATPase